jgi:hypothetical protein
MADAEGRAIRWMRGIPLLPVKLHEDDLPPTPDDRAS